ncbi:MAG: reactive intermediate/imine deaminase [Candidatus Marinimicrobia bacterium]|nr:reactive intermediate/imine deaminase [Candidatus Neomarinimicrobiota bacterium]|tara:strand:- start:45217 stop:45609 length:393 start_codon:yes stop_codon:yes gene_type:complete
MGREIIKTNNAPKAIGVYSQAINIDKKITFTSGQIPIDIKTSDLVSDDFVIQVNQTLKNIEGILSSRNCNLNNLIKLTIYLTDLDNFDKLNQVFLDFFSDCEYPARSVIEVSKLPKNSQIEIEAIFYEDN